MHVAIATPPDIPRLCELLGVLFSQEVEFEADPINQARGLAAIISDPSVGLILVLKDEEKIIGMVNLLFTVSTFVGSKVAMLEDMIIDPAHHGKGAGTFLIEAFKQIAAEQGCMRITLLTDGSNSRAKVFYRKMGFVESAMVPYKLMLP